MSKVAYQQQIWGGALPNSFCQINSTANDDEDPTHIRLNSDGTIEIEGESITGGPVLIGGNSPNTAMTLPDGYELANQLTTPSKVMIQFGTSGTPETTPDVPGVVISQFQSIPRSAQLGDGSGACAMMIAGQTDNSSQLNVFKVIATTNPSVDGEIDDNVAGYFVSVMQGDANKHHTGYAAYYVASVETAGNACVAAGTALLNNSGIDHVWQGPDKSCAFDAVTQDCANSIGAGFQTRAGGGGAIFDVGFAAETGSVKTTFLQNDTASITVFKDTGTHTGGIDFSAATFSGSQIKLAMGTSLTNAANDGAAAAAGVPVGGVYRNGSVLMVRVA